MEGCLPEWGGQERSWGEAQVEHSFLVTRISTPPSPHTSTLIQLFCQGRHYLHGGAVGGGPARLHMFTPPPLLSRPHLYSSSAKDGILFMAGLKEADLRASTHLILKPAKSQAAWRPILGVLTILQVL